MTYPNYFYYYEKTSETQYGTAIQGSPSVTQLIKGRPCWPKPTASSEPKRKSLILSDWTMAQWTKEKVQSVSAQCKSLIDDGFKMYYWEDGVLTPLTKEILFRLKTCPSRPPMPDALRDAITRQHPELTPSNSYIIDDYELNGLLEKHTVTRERIINMSDLLSYEESWDETLELLISYIKTASPPLRKIINNKPSSQTNLLQLKIAQALPQISIDTSTHKEMSDNSVELSRQMHRVKTFELHFDYATFSFWEGPKEADQHQKNSRLSSLKQLTFNHTKSNYIWSAGYIGQIIEQAKELTSLSIWAGPRQVGVIIQELIKNCPQLETLSLQSMSINSSQPCVSTKLQSLCISDIRGPSTMLRQLTGDGSHLRSLSIEQCCTTDAQPLKIEELTLSNLEEFRVSYENALSLAAVKKILNSPQIKQFSFLGNSEAFRHLKASDIPASLALIELTLEDAPIPEETILAILAKGHLRYLHLPYCQHILSIDFTKLPQLRSLEALTLHDARCTSEQLASLLNKIPQLRTLDISHSPSIREINGGDLSQLRILKASYTGIIPHSLYNILLRTPKLIKLELKSCILHQCNALWAINLPILQEINLFKGDISENYLNLLLANAKSLERLKLGSARIESLGANYEKKSINLITLKYLDLSNSNVSESYFLFLLENAPNLKQINLNSIDGIGTWSKKTRQKIANLDIPIVDWDLLRQELFPENLPFSENPTKDQIHDPQKYFHPKEKPSAYKFKGKNKSLNQRMIVEKLSQYLTLTEQHIAFIPQMQHGICHGLATHFNTMAIKEWDTLIKRIAAWDGQKSSLTPVISKDFDNLWRSVHAHQFDQSKVTSCYLGDNVTYFLATKPESILLSNPWHVVALRYLKEEACWYLYDPNYVAGYKTTKNLNELQGFIKQSLGQLVFVDGVHLVSPLINNADNFLRDGGLLALLRANNTKELLKQLSSKDYSKNALQGLFVRDVLGKTVWKKALAHPLLAQYTLTLMEQYKNNHADFEKKLQESMLGLTPQEEHETQVALATASITAPKDKALFIEQLRHTVRPIINHNYRHALETWRKPLATAATPMFYCQQLIAKNAEKTKLIVLDSNQNADALSLELLSHCLSASRPVCCINSPEDLVCSAHWVERTPDNKGIIRKGPGGPLHDFLSKHAGQAPVVIVNYTNFKADDIVRLNSLLDKKRLADGTPVPEDAIVLGLINPNDADAHHGADFYSRFDVIETSPLTTESLQKNVPLAPADYELTTPNENVYFINLAHSTQWEERLLGRWLIKKDQLVFEEGELVKALASRKAICIQNGLWDNPRFQLFWQQAQIRGHIIHAGQVIKIPKNQAISRAEGYHWAALKTRVRFTDSLPPTEKAILINPKSLSDVFSTYEYDKTNATLDTQPGLLEKNKGKTLHLTLTRSLSDDEWGSLLEACKTHQVQLICKRMPGVIIPKAIAEVAPLPPLPTVPWNAQEVGHPLVITSTDSAVTVALMTQNDKNWETIEITESDAGALLGALDGQMGKDHFTFSVRIGAVQKALQDNKKVLLHGQFSHELMDALAPLLLNPLTKGRLVLVSDQASSFQPYSCAHHKVSQAQRHGLLKMRHRATDEEINSLPDKGASFNKLQAQLHYHRAFPLKPNTPWQGMTEALLSPLPAFDALNTKKIADAFMHQRFKNVVSLLTHAPFVCLTGPSGIGKSAFVEDYLNKQPGFTVFKGEARITEWINYKSHGQKILFIDEANITSRQWSEFEGLFNTPPGILVNGVYQPLSANHKVIFAFNPLNYGGERQQAPLFIHHGNALAFTPLPLELIDEYMLKPVLAGTRLAAHQRTLMEPILNVYRFIVAQTQEEVLISPREVQMMALLLLSYAKQHPEAKLKDLYLAAKHYAYRLALPLNKPTHLPEFEKQFKPYKALPHETLPKVMNGFHMTASRQAVSQQLNDLLALRHLRKALGSNKEQQYGGLGGTILEGSPGNGKSELVISILLARGYTETHEYDGPPQNPPPAPIFYRMPVSMSLENKRHLLLKAFDEGAVVVVDEINSSPMMERLLNDLLMGKNPENKPPKHPGFLIIGTQNPAEMGGRITASTAMKRRLMSAFLPDYNPKELREILLNKGVSAEECSTLLEAYQFNCNKAACEHLKPAPTFRSLIRLAEPIGFKLAQEKFNAVRKALIKGDVDANTCFEYANLLIHIEQNYVAALPYLKRAAANGIDGAKRAVETMEVFIKSKSPNEKALMQKNLNQEDAILCFFEQHRQVFTKSRNEFFGSLRRTKVKPYWDLEEILAHGMKNNNRTRSVCVALGWLTSDGKLNGNAPQVIKEACPGYNLNEDLDVERPSSSL